MAEIGWTDPKGQAHVAQSELLRSQLRMMTPGERRRAALAQRLGGLKVWLVLLIVGFGSGFAGLHAINSAASHAKEIKLAADRDAERQRERSHLSNAQMRSFWARKF